jgi:hypothetical protein
MIAVFKSMHLCVQCPYYREYKYTKRKIHFVYKLLVSNNKCTYIHILVFPSIWWVCSASRTQRSSGFVYWLPEELWLGLPTNICQSTAKRLVTVNILPTNTDLTYPEILFKMQSFFARRSIICLGSDILFDFVCI